MAEIEELRRIMECLTNERNELDEKNQNCKREIKKLRAELKTVQDNCLREKQCHEDLQSEYQRVQQEFSELYEKYNQQREGRQRDMEALERANHKLRASLQQAQKKEKGLDAACQRNQEELERLKKCVSEMLVAGDNLEKENARLRQRRQQSRQRSRPRNSSKIDAGSSHKSNQDGELAKRLKMENCCLKKKLLELEQRCARSPSAGVRFQSNGSRTQSCPARPSTQKARKKKGTPCKKKIPGRRKLKRKSKRRGAFTGRSRKRAGGKSPYNVSLLRKTSSQCAPQTCVTSPKKCKTKDCTPKDSKPKCCKGSKSTCCWGISIKRRDCCAVM